jgi:anti-anti-sigma factor
MPDVTGNEGYLELEVSEVGGRTILAPAGALTHENCGTLRSTVSRSDMDRKGDVVLNLERVALVDSEGLEALLEIHNDLERAGRALKLIGLNDVCKDILVVTRLLNVLHVYNDLHAAVQSKVGP